MMVNTSLREVTIIVFIVVLLFGYLLRLVAARSGPNSGPELGVGSALLVKILVVVLLFFFATAQTIAERFSALCPFCRQSAKGWINDRAS